MNFIFVLSFLSFPDFHFPHKQKIQLPQFHICVLQLTVKIQCTFVSLTTDLDDILNLCIFLARTMDTLNFFSVSILFQEIDNEVWWATGVATSVDCNEEEIVQSWIILWIGDYPPTCNQPTLYSSCLTGNCIYR